MIQFDSRADERAFLRKMMQAEAHLRPIVRAAYDGHIGMAMASPTGGFVVGMDRRPFFAIMCDDNGQSSGPSPFDSTFLNWFISNSRLAFIHAWQLDPLFYMTAVATTLITGQSGIFVETRSAHEQDWVDFIDAANAEIHFTIATPPGGTA